MERQDPRLSAVDYANMRIGETRYIVERSTGVYEHVTYSAAYAQAGVIGITKNLTGPSFSLDASAGLFRT